MTIGAILCHHQSYRSLAGIQRVAFLTVKARLAARLFVVGLFLGRLQVLWFGCLVVLPALWGLQSLSFI